MISHKSKDRPRRPVEAQLTKHIRIDPERTKDAPSESYRATSNYASQRDKSAKVLDHGDWEKW